MDSLDLVESGFISLLVVVYRILLILDSFLQRILLSLITVGRLVRWRLMKLLSETI
jgi:hypothetical protein